jgi:membrane associated rhomboid family serine protease
MIPIKDDNPSRMFPLVTILLIVANVVVFIYQWILGGAAQAFVVRFGAIPWEITHFEELSNHGAELQTGLPNAVTLFSSMFIHGGFLHLLGNMLYLWIFGDNVEGLMGHVRFLFFYLICGLAAALTHIALQPNSTVPMVGASGAISGVLGAYLLRFPQARVHVLIFLFWFIRVIKVPALVVLGLWFLMQVISGLSSQGVSGGGGVAWFAHIGGFIAGIVLVLLFAKRR